MSSFGRPDNHTASPSLTVASTSRSDRFSWRQSTGSSCTDIDDVCSLDGSVSEIVPLKVSNSVRRMLDTTSIRSMKLPSPGLTVPPTPDRPLQSSTPDFAEFGEPCSTFNTSLTSAAVATLDNGPLALLNTWQTPSLDGGLDSARSSLDSVRTPLDQTDKMCIWDASLQLQTKAMDVLSRLSTESQPSPTRVDFESPHEMQQRVSSLSIVGKFESPDIGAENEPLSAITVPSPGAFFASFGSSFQQIWNRPAASPEPLDPVIKTILQSPVIDQPSLLPAIDFAAGTPAQTGSEEQASEDCTAGLGMHLQSRAGSSSDDATLKDIQRTQLWLLNQQNYLSMLLSPHPVPERHLQRSSSIRKHRRAPPSDVAHLSVITEETSPLTEQNTPTKCVHFSEHPIEYAPPSPRPSDPQVYHAFQHLIQETQPQDALTFATARFEALQNRRLYLESAHRSFLEGTFTVKEQAKPKKHFLDVSTPEEDALAAPRRDQLSRTLKERDMMQQILPAVWNLAAQKLLNGGSLLSRGALEVLQTRSAKGLQTRILDISPNSVAGWGWAVAAEYRESKVYTTVTSSSSSSDWTLHREPSNHKTVSAPGGTCLPFPSNTFHIVSVGTLHLFLQDQARTMLSEIYRVLAPEGVLQFSMLDNKITAPSNSKLADLSKRFIEQLRSLGHKTPGPLLSLKGLSKLGFEDIKTTWMGLPLGTTDISALTGLVGSLAWEEWLLHLRHACDDDDQREMFDKMLGQVGEAMAEAVRLQPSNQSRTVASGGPLGWKMLVGCATKPATLYDHYEDDADDEGIVCH